MKLNLRFAFLVLLISVGLFSNAYASTDDASDMSSNNLVNLNYYNRPGQFVFKPSVSSTFHAQSGPNSESQTIIGLALSYGAFLDGLRISVSDGDYLNAYSGSGSSFYYTGLNDPNFSLNYRVIDSNPSGLSLDFEFSASPSTGTRVSAEPGSPGSNDQGVGYANLSGGLFWTKGLNELELSGSVERQFGGDGVDQMDNNTTYSQNSLWIETTSLTDRVHVAPKFFVEGSAEFVFGHSTGTLYPDGGGYADQYPFHVIPTIEVGYLHSKQFLITAFVTCYKYTESSVGNLSGATFQNSIYSTSWGMNMAMEF